MNYMQQIIGSKKMENGIVVFWLDGNDRKWDSFTYQELIEMQINALDLLDRTGSYQVDSKAHKIIVKK